MPGPKRKAALLAGTIILHNIPEGFAIAAAFAASSSLGWLVATSIAMQDIPEGLIVAVPLACYGLSRYRSFLWGVFSGLVELIAALAGFFVLHSVSAAMPYALGFSSGAMLYVVVFELLPDALQSEQRSLVASSFLLGAAIAYALSMLVG